MFTAPWLFYANATWPIRAWLAFSDFQLALLRRATAIPPDEAEDPTAEIVPFPRRGGLKSPPIEAASSSGNTPAASGKLISFASYHRAAGLN